MEAIMKLCALTEANVFVLVETQEGRNFCGQRHLCDAYAQGGLKPIGNDVEFEVDPTISSLKERPTKKELSEMYDNPQNQLSSGYSRKRPYVRESQPVVYPKQSKCHLAGDFHGQADARSVVIMVLLRGHNDKPCGRPTPGGWPPLRCI
jgi:hypothetical protein